MNSIINPKKGQRILGYDTGININGVQTTATNSTISLVTPTLTLPAGISIATNGTVNIAAGLLPGQKTFYYKICSNGSCTGTITCVVTIERTFFANPDNITATVGGNLTYSVRNNDQYRGGCGNTALIPATNSNTTITSASIDTYYNINTSSGILTSTQTNVPSGTRTLSYTLCDNANLNICQTVSVLITIPAAKMTSGNNSNSNFDITKTIINPNPTSGIINILFNDSIEGIHNIEIYDIVGRLLIKKHIPLDILQYELDLTNYSNANYFIKIFNNEKSIVFNKTIIKY